MRRTTSAVAVIAVFLLATAFGSRAGERINLDEIAGVYKHRFENGDVQGHAFESEMFSRS